MKIEKLTENKIRVIIHSDELGDSNNINLHNVMAKAMETQEIFSHILKQAEKEVDFHTDGCKLLIEAFSSLEDVFVLTITRYLPEASPVSPANPKKKLSVKRKTFNKTASHAICQFETFDEFYDFCVSIKSLHKASTVKLAKNISLFTWKNAYYLVLKNINTKADNLKLFYSTLSEFGKLLSCSEHFEAKLLEHGKKISIGPHRFRVSLGTSWPSMIEIEKIDSFLESIFPLYPFINIHNFVDYRPPH